MCLGLHLLCTQMQSRSEVPRIWHLNAIPVQVEGLSPRSSAADEDDEDRAQAAAEAKAQEASQQLSAHPSHASLVGPSSDLLQPVLQPILQ